jgi:hypothetical protein
VTTSTLLGLIDDIVISIVLFLVVSLRNTDGAVIQGANSVPGAGLSRQWLLRLIVEALIGKGCGEPSPDSSD